MVEAQEEAGPAPLLAGGEACPEALSASPSEQLAEGPAVRTHNSHTLLPQQVEDRIVVHRRPFLRAELL